MRQAIQCTEHRGRCIQKKDLTLFCQEGSRLFLTAHKIQEDYPKGFGDNFSAKRAFETAWDDLQNHLETCMKRK